MKILTTRQPLADLIVDGYKDIENKSRRTHYRGPVLILASQNIWPVDYKLLAALKIVPKEAVTGGVVGMCHLIDVVEESKSLWFNGKFGYVLSKPKRLPFTPYKGSLAMIDAPKALLRRLGL